MRLTLLLVSSPLLGCALFGNGNATARVDVAADGPRISGAANANAEATVGGIGLSSLIVPGATTVEGQAGNGDRGVSGGSTTESTVTSVRDSGSPAGEGQNTARTEITSANVGVAGTFRAESSSQWNGQPGVAIEVRPGHHGVAAVRGQASLSSLSSADGVIVDGYSLRLGDLGPLMPLYTPTPDDVIRVGDATLQVAVSVAQDERERRVRSGATQEARRTLSMRVSAAAQPSVHRQGVRVHLVLDRSSSMQGAWQDVVAAAHGILAMLTPSDEIQIVVYDRTALEVTPLSRVGTSTGEELATLSVGGGSNIEAGLRRAYDSAIEASRGPRGHIPSLVLLLSDGVPNGGAFDPDALAPLAREARSAAGVTTSVVAFGTEFDGEILRSISSEGRGGYHVAQEGVDLSRVFQAEVQAQLRLVARSASVEVELPADAEVLSASQGAVITGNLVRFDIPQVRVGIDHQLVVRFEGEGQGRVAVQHSGGVPTSATVELGAQQVPAVVAAADFHLGGALLVAAEHLKNGHELQAAAELERHAVRFSSTDVGPLSVRCDAVARFGGAIRALAPNAEWSARRSLSVEMSALGFALRQ